MGALERGSVPPVTDPTAGTASLSGLAVSYGPAEGITGSGEGCGKKAVLAESHRAAFFFYSQWILLSPCSYDERFENILVTYDGTDAATLERVKAAVNALRR